MTETVLPPQEPAVEPPEPVRVLVPSPLGSLGIEFLGAQVTRLLIVPARRERRHFATLKEADRSDFLDESLGRLSEYFAGARRNLGIDFSLERADLPPFHRRVLEETARIPYGATRSYQKLAAAAGDPEAYRLVRSILIANPIPILIPCHRVVTRKGTAGSYIGGEKKKNWLLKLESKGVHPL